MLSKHLNITYAYHFMSEAIIFFLIITPVLYLHYRFIPYYSYIIIAILLCMVSIFLSKQRVSYQLYLLIALPLLAVFYLFDYPHIVNVVITGVLIWRYINIRSRSMVDLNRENGYLILTLILTALAIMIVGDSQIIIYACLQVTMLIFGNILSHLAVLNKQDRHVFRWKTSTLILLPLTVGTILFIPLYHSGHLILFKLWDGFSLLIFILASTVGKILQLFENGQDGSELDEIEDGMPFIEDDQFNKNETESLIEVVAPYIFIAVILILMIIFVIFVFKLSKRFKQRKSPAFAVSVATYDQIDEKERGIQSVFASIKQKFSRPAHPVRRYVYDFERKMSHTDNHRRPFETVEEWLTRIGLDDDLTTYQKVRYGEEEVPDEDIKQLKNHLIALESASRSK